MGGAGRDTASYSARTVALNISLDGVANDGAPGEGDNNRTNIENVNGGTRDDTIRGNSGSNRLFGGQGNDNLNTADGFPGNDRLDDSFGFDICTSDPGDIEVGCEA